MLSQSNRAVKSVILIIFLAFISKFLGFIREVLIAAKFGAGAESDIFFIALTATGVFTSLLTNAINTTMIPILSEIDDKEGSNGKIKHTNNLLNIILFLSLIMVIIGWLLAPLIIKMIAHGFGGEQYDLAVSMLRIGLPVLFFSGTVGVLRGYLQSELLFTESASSQFPFNFVYILFLIFLSDLFGIKGLMVTSVLAVGAQISFQIPGLKKSGYKYNFEINLKDPYIKKIVYLIPPVFVSVAVNDLNKIVDRSLASTLVEGSVSALNYGNRLKSLISGTFSAAIATVMFPMLSKEASKNNYEGFKKIMQTGINSILLIIIPASMIIIFFARPMVRIAFERGAFDANATNMTTGALVFYSIGLTGMALRPLLEKVYYSLQDTRTPMKNAIMAIGFNIVLNLVLVRFMYHNGLALATSIASIITTILLLYGLKKKIGSIGIILMCKCGLKSFSASLVMVGLSHYIYIALIRKFYGNIFFDLIALACAVSVGALIYIAIIYALKVEELSWIISLVKNKISRSRDKSSKKHVDNTF